MKFIIGSVRFVLHLLVRLVIVPIKVALAMVGLAFRAGATIGTAPVRVGWRATRRAGVKAVACFGFGVAVGLLFAPRRGRDIRQALLQRVRSGGAPTDGELVDQVRSELAHAPTTWHLPQPEVEVVAGVVSLRGEVPHPEAIASLTAATQAIPGVVGVDASLTVTNGTGVAHSGDEAS